MVVMLPFKCFWQVDMLNWEKKKKKEIPKQVKHTICIQSETLHFDDCIFKGLTCMGILQVVVYTKQLCMQVVILAWGH